MSRRPVSSQQSTTVDSSQQPRVSSQSDNIQIPTQNINAIFIILIESRCGFHFAIAAVDRVFLDDCVGTVDEAAAAANDLRALY